MRGSGVSASAGGGWGSGGKVSISRHMQGGSGGGAHSARRFLQFFNKNNAFLGIFRLKFCFKACSDNS